MSGQIVFPDPSGVEHHNSNHRRQYMTTVFRQLGLWDELNQRPKAMRVREESEELICKTLDRKGWHNVSHPFFEYVVDKAVWQFVRK